MNIKEIANALLLLNFWNTKNRSCELLNLETINKFIDVVEEKCRQPLNIDHISDQYDRSFCRYIQESWINETLDRAPLVWKLLKMSNGHMSLMGRELLNVCTGDLGSHKHIFDLYIHNCTILEANKLLDDCLQIIESFYDMSKVEEFYRYEVDINYKRTKTMLIVNIAITDRALFIIRDYTIRFITTVYSCIENTLRNIENPLHQIGWNPVNLLFSSINFAICYPLKIIPLDMIYDKPSYKKIIYKYVNKHYRLVPQDDNKLITTLINLEEKKLQNWQYILYSQYDKIVFVTDNKFKIINVNESIEDYSEYMKNYDTLHTLSPKIAKKYLGKNRWKLFVHALYLNNNSNEAIKIWNQATNQYRRQAQKIAIARNESILTSAISSHQQDNWQKQYIPAPIGLSDEKVNILLECLISVPWDIKVLICDFLLKCEVMDVHSKIFTLI